MPNKILLIFTMISRLVSLNLLKVSKNLRKMKYVRVCGNKTQMNTCVRLKVQGSYAQ